ncbi:MAG: hypothetical protein F4X98_04010 [Gammaproteobacteria bacterium]|nr:hypothetical protein [Gammaproteobacteria bacterium]
MNGSEQTPDHAASAPVGRATTLPSWLDARTIAMLTTMVTIGLALGAMVQTTHARLANEIAELRQDGREDFERNRTGMAGLRDELKADMDSLRNELKADMDSLRDELKADMDSLRNELGTDIDKLDVRLRAVEVDVGAIREGLNSVKIDVAAIRERLSSVEIDVATIRGTVAGDAHLGSTGTP